MFLFREREENLRLIAENDALRIKDYENNRSIDVLLKLSGINRDDLMELLSGVSYFYQFFLESSKKNYCISTGSTDES